MAKHNESNDHLLVNLTRDWGVTARAVVLILLCVWIPTIVVSTILLLTHAVPTGLTFLGVAATATAVLTTPKRRLSPPR